MRVVVGLVAVLILLAVAGMAAMYAGVVNVAASEPHAPAVRWLAATTLRQSVRAHARAIVPPTLGDPILVEEGAKLFQSHCAICHGAPGVDAMAFARHMRPAPPRLSEAAGDWTSAELFWIVKHGLTMTGMPAWGATHVDGEIWSMVAFLNQLPTMAADRYRAIVEPQQPPPPQASEHPHEDESLVPPDEEGAGEPLPAPPGPE